MLNPSGHQRVSTWCQWWSQPVQPPQAEIAVLLLEHLKCTKQLAGISRAHGYLCDILWLSFRFQITAREILWVIMQCIKPLCLSWSESLNAVIESILSGPSHASEQPASMVSWVSYKRSWSRSSHAWREASGAVAQRHWCSPRSKLYPPVVAMPTPWDV